MLLGEEMKQWIKAICAENKGYYSGMNQDQQNQMFVNNQELFFQQLNNEGENH